MSNAKQEKKLRKLVRQATATMQMTAENVLNGIKDDWSLQEREILAKWLLDDTAGRWGG